MAPGLSRRLLFFRWLHHPALPWLLLAFVLIEWAGERVDHGRYQPPPLTKEEAATPMIDAFTPDPNPPARPLAELYQEMENEAAARAAAEDVSLKFGLWWDELKHQAAWPKLPAVFPAVLSTGSSPRPAPIIIASRPTLPDAAYFPPQTKPSFGETEKKGTGGQLMDAVFKAVGLGRIR